MRALLLAGAPSPKVGDMEADFASGAQDAIELAEAYDYDVLIVRVPAKAPEVVRALRYAKVRLPIVVLAREGTPDDVALALDLGADAWITLPQTDQELGARLRAVIRRAQGYSSSTLRVGRLEVHLAWSLATIDGRRLALTATEHTILELLALRKGKDVMREQLLDRLRQNGKDEPCLNTLERHISNIRKKIAAMTGGQHYITTVAGRGYTLEGEPDNALP